MQTPLTPVKDSGEAGAGDYSMGLLLSQISVTAPVVPSGMTLAVRRIPAMHVPQEGELAAVVEHLRMVTV
jgi:hypothetical protein